ncbi:MAG: hypothetical protein IT169_18855 [Bryobacterales bacterium]|nr:hypothetical protein [Bryobacterales bacterium]
MIVKHRLHTLALLLATVPFWPGNASLRAESPASGDAEMALARDGASFEAALRDSRRVMEAWLREADPETLLMPDRVADKDGSHRDGRVLIYTAHNSGADLYPYLILTAHLTDPSLLHGRLLEMLRSEARFTWRADSVPGSFDLRTRQRGEASIFSGAEYAKDGMLAVTELLGRTPWFHRMADLMLDLRKHSTVKTRFGTLPGADAETNGDVLQVLVRLATMTNDPRYRAWAREIADAYVGEILPGSEGLPSYRWNFESHQGEPRIRLRDHGNEAVVGLTLLYALEKDENTPYAAKYEPAIRRMLDRILASANEHGMLYNVIDAATLAPLDKGISDNWGYIYGAVYTFYQVTGEGKYREAVRKVLRNLPNYRNFAWERDSFDGYADSLEGALYLVAREPVPEALDWIESETRVMRAMQRPDGHLEYWYGEGNYNRTLILYAMWKSLGCLPDHWVPGLELSAHRDGDGIRLRVARTGLSASWDGRVRFDFARHRRVMNLPRDYVRLNEFPESFTVDEGALYTLQRDGGETVTRLGVELIEGIPLRDGIWRISPVVAKAGGPSTAAPAR